MSKDWGIRISKPGKDVVTGSDPEMVFSSKFDNLRIHAQGSGSIYDSTGRTITIPHNLGYVPIFIVHSKGDSLYTNTFTLMDGKYMLAPIQAVISDIGSDYYYYNRSTLVWADSTNLYIKLEDDFGYLFCLGDGEADNFGHEASGYSYSSGQFAVGKWSTGETVFGALRFNNINTSGSVHKATLGIYISYTYPNTTQVKTWGFDEDNTGGLGSSPYGRTRTSAYVTGSRDSGLTAGNTWAYDVTSIFNEIATRGGWSSGNHMGFIMEDNGSSNNSDFGSYNTDDSGFPHYTPLTYLKYLKNDLLTTYRYTIFKNKIA